MNRREVITRGMAGLTAGYLLSPRLWAEGEETIYVNVQTGIDANPGTKQSPLKTLAAATKHVGESKGSGPVTIILSEGVYPMNETAQFKPSRAFGKTNRLTVRAEVLPDDADWSPARMPVLIQTMPLKSDWMGRPDPFGGVGYGIQVETSHVTIRGFRILGSPHLEEPAKGKIRRIYPIAREGNDLEDLEVKQCMFVGDPNSLVNHCGVLSRGHGVVVDHCVFYRCKITIVYWTGGAHDCAMRNCLAVGNYGTACWLCATGDDFEFRNNVISDNHCGLLFQGPVGKYKPADSTFAGNQYLYGAGFGPPINFRPLEPAALELPKSVRVLDKPVQIEFDQTKRNYLHLVEGTVGSEIGAGLFTKV